MWFNAQSLSPSISSLCPPALAMHGGKLHMVYVNTADFRLYHAVFTPSDTGGTWASSLMPGQWSGVTPALIEFRGQLTCVYRAYDTSYHLFITTLDDATGVWTTVGSGTIATQYAPTIAVHEGLLYAVILPTGSGTKLSYVTWDGLSGAWTAPVPINTVTNPTTTLAPTLVSYCGGMHLLIESGGTVQHYQFSNSLVPNQAFIPLASTGLSTTTSVAALEWNGLLYALLRTSSSTIVSATFDGGTWTATSSTITATTSQAPAAAAQGDMLQLVIVNGSKVLQQASSFAGGGGPLSRIPIAGLGGSASLLTGVSSSNFSGMRPYAVEVWVNPSSTSGTQYIVSSFNTAIGDGYMAIALRDGKFAAYRNGTWLSSVTVPVVNTWYHVTLTFDGATYAALYVNGNLESTAINNQPAAPASSGPVMIGAASNGTTGTPANRLSGKVRWAAFWTTNRTTEEVSTDLYSRPAPQPGLLALYDFARATPIDVSGRSQSATLQGSVALAAETPVLALSGSNGIDCGSGNTLSFAGNQAMSIEAWVYPTSSASTSYVVQRAGAYSLGFDSSGWFGSAGGQSTIRSGSAPKLNQWTHVALTWAPAGSNATMTLYVDGVAKAYTSKPTSGAANTNHTTIGCTSSAGSGVHGYLASVHVWSKALAANDVLAAMTQSPVGLDHLAANYEFSTVPVVDATNENTIYSITDPSSPDYPGTQLFPTNIGSPTQSYLSETISATDAAQLLGIDTAVSVPYFPSEPGEVFVFEEPSSTPARPNAEALPSSVDDILTPNYFQQLLDTFHRSLPPGTSDAVRRQLASAHVAELERLFMLARSNPRGGLGGHRFGWEQRGEHSVLIHHRPDGSKAELGVFATATFTAVQLWWIQFTLTLVFGFASVLGISSPGEKVAKSLTKFITTNVVVLTVLEATVDVGIAITPEVIYKSLGQLWKSNLLFGMLKIIAISLSWWALAKLGTRLIALFVPGAQEVVVATMLFNFTLMAVQLSLLALDYPRS